MKAVKEGGFIRRGEQSEHVRPSGSSRNSPVRRRIQTVCLRKTPQNRTWCTLLLALNFWSFK